MTINNLKIFLLSLSAILVAVFFISTALISKDAIRSQIDPNISFKNLSIIKFPYPKIEITDVTIGKNRIEKAKLKMSIISILFFSHKIKDIEFENLEIFSDGNFLSLSDYHNFAKTILSGSIDFNMINFINMKIYQKDMQEYYVPSAKLVCALKKCNFSGETFNLDISPGSGDIIDLSASITTDLYKIDAQEKYDVKSGNFFGGFIAEIKAQESVKIKGEIVGSKDITHFRNISAESIILKGAADYAVFFNKSATFKANIDFLSLTEDEAKNCFSAGNILKFSDTDFNINIASASIAKEKIKDIKITANTQDKQINLETCSGLFEQNENFQVSGKVSEKYYGNAFDGHINFTYPDVNKLLQIFGLDTLSSTKKEAVKSLSFISDLHISNNNYHISNIDSKIGESLFKGDFGVRLIGDSPRIISSLEIISMDLWDQNYPVISKLFSYNKSLAKNMKDENYADKLQVIKKFPYKVNFDLYFHDALIGKYKIDHMRSNFRIKNSYIELKKLDISGQDLSLNATAELQSWGVKPLLFLNIYKGDIKKFDYDLLDIQDYIAKDIDFKKVQLNMPVALDSLSSEKIEVKNLRAGISSDDSGGIKVTNFSMDIFGGRLVSTSYISPNPFTIESTYGYSNFLLEPLVSYISRDSSKILGVASANGRFKVVLEDHNKILENIALDGNYIAKFITLENFGIDNYIEQITKKDYDAKSRLEYDTYQGSYNGTTEIPLCAGSIQVKDGVASFQDSSFTTKYTSASITGGVQLSGFVASDLGISFEFIKPSNTIGNVASEKQKIKIPMKVESNIFSPVRTMDVSDIKSNLFK